MTRPPKLLAAQCRGARAMLDLSIAKLGRASGVPAERIRHFERDAIELASKDHGLLRQAFEQKGVTFIDADDHGPGVRFTVLKAAEGDTA